jgi:hypothetical protein
MSVSNLLVCHIGWDGASDLEYFSGVDGHFQAAAF